MFKKLISLHDFIVLQPNITYLKQPSKNSTDVENKDFNQVKMEKSYITSAFAIKTSRS